MSNNRFLNGQGKPGAFYRCLECDTTGIGNCGFVSCPTSPLHTQIKWLNYTEMFKRKRGNRK